MNDDPVASDVMAPSMWTIIGCKNGKKFSFFNGTFYVIASDVMGPSFFFV